MGATTYLKRLLEDRRALLELLAAAGVLGLGVNLIASAIVHEIPFGLAALGGAVLSVAAVCVIGARTVVPAARVIEYSGFFLLNSETNELPECDFRYRFGHDMRDYLVGAFAENAALKTLWDRDVVPRSERKGPPNPEPEARAELARQATEYYVLASLSTHLHEFFGNSRTDDVEVLSQRDVPDVLLDNRFLRLFSEPLEDREAFLKGRSGHRTDIVFVPAGGSEEIVYRSQTEHGALYERFELALPKGSLVRRPHNTVVEIRTRRFTITVETNVPGFINPVLPREYLRDYLGLDHEPKRLLDVDAHCARAAVTIRPNRIAVIWPRGWHLYRWIDSWLEELEDQMSHEAYFRRIGWETVETMLKSGIGRRPPTDRRAVAHSKGERQGTAPSRVDPAEGEERGDEDGGP